LAEIEYACPETVEKSMKKAGPPISR